MRGKAFDPQGLRPVMVVKATIVTKSMWVRQQARWRRRFRGSRSRSCCLRYPSTSLIVERHVRVETLCGGGGRDFVGAIGNL